MEDHEARQHLVTYLLLIILVLIPLLAYAIPATMVGRLAVLRVEDPREYNKWFINFLGVQVNLIPDDDEPPSDPTIPDADDIGTFPVTYWNGYTVNFYVTEEVLSASQATDCDPWLLVAVAFSESSNYNNTDCSNAGACGVWQFIPGTWAWMWSGQDVPSRFDIPAAATAACKYMKLNGMTKSINTSKVAFIYDFAVEPPVWNRHVGQAGFVWDLVQEIRQRGGNITPIDPPHTDPNLPITITGVWWKIPIVWLFNQLGMIPDVLAFNPNPDYPITPQEGDDWIAMPYPPGTYTINGGLHGQSYGECALDLSRGLGKEVLSPIKGVVTQRYTDVLDNPIIQIENSIYTIRLYHGDWEVRAGESVSIMQKVGYENTHGNSTGPHTHFHVLKKGEACISPDLLINYPQDEP